jgi:hypothetical protein
MSARNLLAAVIIAVTTTAALAACGSEKRDEPRTSTKSPTARPTATPSPDTNASPASTLPSSYVGTRYDPMPAGVTYESGTVLLGRDGKPSRFAISKVRTPTGTMVWLDEILPDAGPARRRVVRAAVAIPRLLPGQRVVIGTCGLAGRFNGDVIAVVSESGAHDLQAVRAWRANSSDARFDAISTTGVTCEEPAGEST